jgi:hypothetical protein
MGPAVLNPEEYTMTNATVTSTVQGAPLIGWVTLEATHEYQIDYRIGIYLGDKVAPPRRNDLIPQLEVSSKVLSIT